MGVEVKLFQGWFGREYQKNEPDIAKLGFSEEILKHHKEKESGETKVEDNPTEADNEPENAKEISPPKPRKKKKK